MLTTTFQARISSLTHKQSPATAGSAPATTLSLNAGALETEIAAKLHELANGHSVQVTIEQIQERMPLTHDAGGEPEPTKPDVPEAFKYEI